jgi:DNA-directed RNA polymerase specialized sigma subunit
LDTEYDIDADLEMQKAHDSIVAELHSLEKTRMWAQSKIFQMYWMSDKTLDEVAKDIGISKSTTFLAVRKIKNYLKEVIDDPYKA